MALIIEVKAIGLEYDSGSVDWLKRPKRQMKALIGMALDVFWRE